MFTIFFIVYNVSAKEKFQESNIVWLFYLLPYPTPEEIYRHTHSTTDILAWDAWIMDYHDAQTSNAEDGQLEGGCMQIKR